MKDKIRILVADAQQVVRNGVRAMLESQEELKVSITEVETGPEVIDITGKRKFDLLIIDVLGSKSNGLATIRRLKELGNKVPVIVMGLVGEVSGVRRAMEWGTLGFIGKDIGVSELVKAIKTVRREKHYFCNEVAQLMINHDRRLYKKSKEHLNLTKREWQILQLMTEEFTTDEIALTLNISKRTVEGHRTNLKAKLQVRTTIGLVKFAMENSHLNRWAS